MADRATFLAEFSEFADVPATVVDAKLALAELRTDASVWGERVDAGIYYLTAHLLAMSPNATALAKCCLPDGKTTYLQERMRMVRALGSAARLADPDFIDVPEIDCYGWTV